MQKTTIFLSALLFLIISSTFVSLAQTAQNTSQSLDKRDPWTPNDLIQPAELASILTNKKAQKPVIYNIGVVEDIAGAQKIGAASKKENLDQLRKKLNPLPKNTSLVIYCGCCPFEKCPNIRPAFTLMKNLGLTNGKLLNIPVNIKQNWINLGYPMAKN